MQTDDGEGQANIETLKSFYRIAEGLVADDDNAWKTLEELLFKLGPDDLQKALRRLYEQCESQGIHLTHGFKSDANQQLLYILHYEDELWCGHLEVNGQPLQTRVEDLDEIAGEELREHLLHAQSLFEANWSVVLNTLERDFWSDYNANCREPGDPFVEWSQFLDIIGKPSLFFSLESLEILEASYGYCKLFGEHALVIELMLDDKGVYQGEGSTFG